LEEEKYNSERANVQYKEVDEKFNSLLKKYQELKLSHLDIEQHSKKVETSLDKYIKEIESLKQSNSEYKKELEMLIPKLEYNTMNNTRLEQELKVASDNLSVTIKAKNTADDINYQLSLQLTKLKTQIIEKDMKLLSIKLSYMNIREIVLHENKMKAVDNQTDLIKTTLANKIKMVEERLKSEINTKESLMLQFNNEEKVHSETKKTYVNTASELEEYKLKLKNTENVLCSRVKTFKETVNEKNVLQKIITKLEAEKEVLKIEKDKTTELSKKVEEFYKDKQRAKSTKKREERKEYELKLVKRYVMYEDIYSRCVHLY
jgi:hypothetical protein